MCTSSPSAPAPPPAVPEAPVAPDVGAAVGGDRDVRRRRAATGGGRSTILTGSRGIQDGGATAQKTLLGQ
jgi:hypothetical protein